MPLRPPVSDNDHLQGNANAPIELLEYGDYQCPFCGMANGEKYDQSWGKDELLGFIKNKYAALFKNK
jgi:protein-disulfide isomerase